VGDPNGPPRNGTQVGRPSLLMVETDRTAKTQGSAAATDGDDKGGEG